MNTHEHKGIKHREIVEELETSFIEYAMSVILSRAIPDARDGLKPVHRRILFAMQELGMIYSTPYKKSARVVGEVLAKYHPHGDSSVYEAMVRLAQNFSTRYPLVDGQGNFGSIDGDRAAAMRYTEVRLSKIATELFYDMDKETVDFVPNYDGEEKEPSVLPSKLPLLLVNGSTGIAVGMATNIPPHNLEEVLDAVLYILESENNEKTFDIDDILKFVKGPDFPTGAKILGQQGIIDAYRTGKGTVIVQAKADIKKVGDKSIIQITEIPYQTEKAGLIEKINELVVNKKIDGIAHFHDDSANEEVNIEIEVKKGANPEVVLNKIFKMTRLQLAFSISMLAVLENAPKTFNLIDILQTFSKHQKEVLRRKTKYDLKRAQDRLHILEGLQLAITNINELVKILKESTSAVESTKKVKQFLETSDAQTKAILDMKLQRLTHLETNVIDSEVEKLNALIIEYDLILKNKVHANEVIIKSLKDIRLKYPSPRKTEIIEGDFKLVDEEDLIPKDDIIIDITRNGYVRQQKLDSVEDEKVIPKDTVIRLSTSTHNQLVALTNFGKVYGFKGYNVPEVSKSQWGLPIQNIIGIDKGENIVSLLDIEIYSEDQMIVLFTKNGIIKKVELGDYARANKIARQALVFNAGDDELVNVFPVFEKDHFAIQYNQNKFVSFDQSNIKPTGPKSNNNPIIRLDTNQVISKVLICNEDDNNFIVAVSSNGHIKFAKPDNLSDRPVFKDGNSFIAVDIFSESEGTLVDLVKVNNDQIVVLKSPIRDYKFEIDEFEIDEDTIIVHKSVELDEDETIRDVEVITETREEFITEELGEDEPTTEDDETEEVTYDEDETEEVDDAIEAAREEDEDAEEESTEEELEVLELDASEIETEDEIVISDEND